MIFFGCFIIISAWESALPFIWRNLNPHHPMIYILCLIWLVWPIDFRGKALKISLCIFAISLLSLHNKGVTLHLNILKFTSPKILCAKFGWNWTDGFEDEIWKRDGQTTDNVRQAIRKAQLNFQLRWAKNFMCVLLWHFI